MLGKPHLIQLAQRFWGISSTIPGLQVRKLRFLEARRLAQVLQLITGKARDLNTDLLINSELEGKGRNRGLWSCFTISCPSDSLLLIHSDKLVHRQACTQPLTCVCSCPSHLLVLYLSCLLSVQFFKLSRDVSFSGKSFLVESPWAILTLPSLWQHIPQGSGVPCVPVSSEHSLGLWRAWMPSYSSLWVWHCTWHSGCWLKDWVKNFPGGPVVNTPLFQCRENRFYPQSGN